MNQPAKYDFRTHYRGDGLQAFEIQFRRKESLEPIDLSGCIVIMQLRAKYTSKLAFQFSSDNIGDATIIIIDPEGGIIQIPEIKQWDIAASTYEYDLEITDSDGFRRTYLRGNWTVNQDITK